MTKEEQLITFLLNKFKCSSTNKIIISKKDIQNINLTEQEIIQSIFLLQEDDILSIERKSVHNDFSMYWTVALKSKCVHYFDDKKDKSVADRREWVRTYIPIIISFIALLKSFYPEIILGVEQILKLIRQ